MSVCKISVISKVWYHIKVSLSFILWTKRCSECDKTATSDELLIEFLQIFAVCNIAIDISALIHLHDLDRTMEPQEKFIYFPPGSRFYIDLVVSHYTILAWCVCCCFVFRSVCHNYITTLWSLLHMRSQLYVCAGIIPLIYIELVASVIMFILGAVLFVGINYVSSWLTLSECLMFRIEHKLCVKIAQDNLADWRCCDVLNEASTVKCLRIFELHCTLHADYIIWLGRHWTSLNLHK